MDRASSDHSEDVVIITGAGGRLGRAMARRLLRDGFRCVLTDRNEEALADTVASADAASGLSTTVAAAIRLPAGRERLIARAIEQPGSLFALVNNAGFGRLRPLLDKSVDDWRATLETNLEAGCFLAQGAIELMRSHARGRIVNIASAHGIIGLDNRGLDSYLPETTEGDRGPVRQSAYAASKGGLIQLTRDLATAVGRWGISVHAVSPGNVPHDHDDEPANDVQAGPRTPPQLGDRLGPEVLRVLAAQAPLGRLGKAEEIAGPVRFLLSDDASYITGANLVVDGGWTIW